MTQVSLRRAAAPLSESEQLHPVALYAAGALSADTARSFKQIDASRRTRARLRRLALCPHRIGALRDRGLVCKRVRPRAGQPKEIAYWLTAAGLACASELDAGDAAPPAQAQARRRA
ncbi:MAG: hypothetical protein BroJett013_30210 [Alphaproteobacteria bacterium]|nr:MAG: hypothetical protein BroJett013_30210 [Alphaproteobacteria bacterium]